jgi:hypothetical protein
MAVHSELVTTLLALGLVIFVCPVNPRSDWFLLGFVLLLTYQMLTMRVIKWAGTLIKECIDSVFRAKRFLQDGYQKACVCAHIPLFSKQSKPFEFPVFNGPQVMLPMTAIKTLLREQGDKLSAVEAHFDLLESDHMLLSEQIRNAHYHEDVVRGSFSKHLRSSTVAAWDEIIHSVDNIFGSHVGDEKRIPLYSSLNQVTAGVATRILIGQQLCQSPLLSNENGYLTVLCSLCRDERYLTNIARFSMGVAIGSVLIKLVPSFMRP